MAISPGLWIPIGLALRAPVSFSRSAARQLASLEQAQGQHVRPHPALAARARRHPVSEQQEPDRLWRRKVLRQAGAEPLPGLAMLEPGTFAVQQALELALVRFAGQEPVRRQTARRQTARAPGRLAGPQPARTCGRPAGREPVRRQIATQWLSPEPRRGP
jgi:hypothetical protein